MLSKKDLDILTQQAKAMEALVETYQEISSIQMRNIRSEVLASRGFIDDLELIYQQIEYSYHNQVLKLRKKAQEHTGEKKGKVLAILVSANTGLVGDSIMQTFDLFTKYITTHTCDALVIGKLGRRLMQERLPQVQFQFYNGPETDEMTMDIAMLHPFINTMIKLSYDDIYIFYSKFRSFASQTPYMLDVYGQAQMEAAEEASKVNYLFEPNLEEVLQFFQQEIFAMIIQQAFSESSLAKYAARLVTLSSATDNISKYLKKLELERKIVTHRIENQKLQQRFASKDLWNIR